MLPTEQIQDFDPRSRSFGIVLVEGRNRERHHEERAWELGGYIVQNKTDVLMIR